MRMRSGFLASCVLLATTFPAWNQAKPPVPSQYQRLFYSYADRRSLFEKALNAVGLTSLETGRSFALIAGVTQYPNFPVLDRELKPAEVDIQKLAQYLKDEEFFDEIVVLKDADMTYDNLQYFLENYFPARLTQSPHSRFLFGYSGHGYANGKGGTAQGFLLKDSATALTDTVNAIPLAIVRTLLDPSIDAAEHTLVLINACYSGAFLSRKPFGPRNLGLEGKGAHAIMASRMG